MRRKVRAMKQSMLCALVIGPLLVIACGGGVPAVGASRESGQSALMEKTFAGTNKCSPKNHERPFIIEWDATDMSQFEALTASDIVFVKYTGCELSIVDSCKNDSVKGSLGAYKPVDWTSGSIEKVEIKNEAELFAKLPLGAASLGARVSAGESFRMEYFVSGTRSATRPAAYKADLAKMPGCKGVTHFVYAYNLGAFALGSNKNINGEAGATLWGAGAGGNSKYASAVEKKGGLLATCRGESAQEIATCKTPIRLTLREIEDGENPDAKAAVAAETPDAKNLAGKVDAKIKLNEKAEEFWQSAMKKAVSRDGKGCLAELDSKDKADPRPNTTSTNPASYYSELRARCLMIAGQCDAGKVLYRKYAEGSAIAQYGAEQIDKSVTQAAAMNCQGDSMSPKDQFMRAHNELSMGANITKKEPAACKSAIATYLKLRKTVKQDDDTKNVSIENIVAYGPACLVRAGDCNGAWAAAKELTKLEREETGKETANSPQSLSNRWNFMSDSKCRVKDITIGIEPAEKVAVAAHDLDVRDKKEPSFCKESIDIGIAAARTLRTKADSEAQQLQDKKAMQEVRRKADGDVRHLQDKAALCLAKAGDCAGSRKIYIELGKLLSYNDKKAEENFLKAYANESDYNICKDK
jgi:hypothetical protein